MIVINQHSGKLKIRSVEMPNAPYSNHQTPEKSGKTIFKKTLIFTQIFLVNLIKICTFKYELHQRIDTNPS